jgi:broad specificity phosphatase PhoE
MHFPDRLRVQLIRAGVGLLILLNLSGCAPAGSQQGPDEAATTLLIVRHAEKAAEPADDPPLTEAGRARAATLAGMAASSGVSAIYATQYLRTQQTVEPLAAQLGLPVGQQNSKDTDGLVAQVLAEHRGQTVVVAAHSDSVPLLVEKLTGKAAAPIEENEYDNLYVVTSRGPGRGTAVRLRYGASSAVSSAEMEPAATP